jgi:hypothetical protein
MRDGALGRKPAGSILIQTYSFGGIAAQGAIQELATRKDGAGASELSKFKRLDVISIMPPDCGYSASDMFMNMPAALQWIAKPITKALGYAMSADMGTQSDLFKAISLPHPDNVHISSARAVGDLIASSTDEASSLRKAQALSQADAVITMLGDHAAGVDPLAFKRQGLSPYQGASQTSALAAKALAYASASGLDTERDFPHAVPKSDMRALSASIQPESAIARTDLGSSLSARRLSWRASTPAITTAPAPPRFEPLE